MLLLNFNHPFIVIQLKLFDIVNERDAVQRIKFQAENYDFQMVKMHLVIVEVDKSVLWVFFSIPISQNYYYSYVFFAVFSKMFCYPKKRKNQHQMLSINCTELKHGWIAWWDVHSCHGIWKILKYQWKRRENNVEVKKIRREKRCEFDMIHLNFVLSLETLSTNSSKSKSLI